jgi:hypothetical protein
MTLPDPNLQWASIKLVSVDTNDSAETYELYVPLVQVKYDDVNSAEGLKKIVSDLIEHSPEPVKRGSHYTMLAASCTLRSSVNNVPTMASVLSLRGAFLWAMFNGMSVLVKSPDSSNALTESELNEKLTHALLSAAR